MSDDLIEEKEEAEGEIPAPVAIAEEEDHADGNDPFLDGFGDEGLDPEEADALAAGYRIRGGHSEEEEEEDFFSGEED